MFIIGQREAEQSGVRWYRPRRGLACGLSITSEKREFFIAVGERIARLRKEHGITHTLLRRCSIP